MNGLVDNWDELHQSELPAKEALQYLDWTWESEEIYYEYAHNTDAERTSRVRPLVVQWYREHASARLPECVALWSGKVGVTAPEVLVREQQKRWGSCDAKGHLRFNWRIIQAPMRLVDYVVAHELVHLLHPNHDTAFWATLGKAMPDYEDRRQALREFGAGVEW